MNTLYLPSLFYQVKYQAVMTIGGDQVPLATDIAGYFIKDPVKFFVVKQ